MRLLALGCLVPLGWILSSCSDPAVTEAPRSAGEVASVGAAAEGRGIELEGPGTEPGPDRSDPTVELAPAERTAVPPDSPYEYDGSRIVTGRVVFPEGTPADERCQLVLECSAPREDADSEEDDWAGLMSLMQPDFEEVRRIDIEPGGRFELEVPSNTDVYRLVIEGHYLFLPGSSILEEDMAFDLPVVLRPILGSWVTFRLIPPKDTPHDPSVLVGRQLRMVIPTSRSYDTRTEEIDDSLAAEFQGLWAPDGQDFGYRVDRNREDEDGPLHLAPFAGPFDASYDFEPGQRVEIEVALEDGLFVQGRVVDEQGGAAVGVRVRAQCELGSRTSSFYSTTDPQGGFRFNAIPGVLASLSTRPDGYEESSLVGDALGEGNDRAGLELVLSRGLGISGTLRFEDGDPVRGTSITASPRDGGQFSQRYSSKTDDAGAFRITGIPEGLYHLHARGSYDPDGDGQPVRGSSVPGTLALRMDREGVASGTSGLDLVMGAGVSLGISVVDQTGAFLESYTARARHLVFDPKDDFGGRRGGGASLQVMDASGPQTFSGLAPGRHVVWVQHNDHAQSEVQLITLLDDSESLEFTLPKLGFLAGRVEGSRGPGSLSVRLSYIEGRMRSYRGQVKVDETGTFRFDRAFHGSYRLEVEGEGGIGLAPLELELPPGGSRDDLVLEVSRGGWVECTVRYADGTPAKGVSVSAVGPEGGDRLRAATCDGDGKAKVGPLPQGEVELRVSLRAEGQRESETLRQNIVVAEGTTASLLLQGTQGKVVRPPTGTISGRLTGGAQGVDLDRMGVSAVPLGESGAQAYDQVSSSGVFRIDGVEPGEYELRANPVRFPSFRGFSDPMGELPGAGRGVLGPIRVAPGEELEGLVIELQPVGRIRGRVVDPGADPIAEAWVEASNPDRDRSGSFPVRTDVDGRFVLHDLSSGSWALRSHSESGVTMGELEVVVQGSEEVELENPLVLHPGTKLSIVLSSSLETEGVEIRIRDQEGLDRARSSPFTLGAGSTGARTFVPLPPGTYRVQCVESERILAERTLELTGEPSLEVSLGD